MKKIIVKDWMLADTLAKNKGKSNPHVKVELKPEQHLVEKDLLSV